MEEIHKGQGWSCWCSWKAAGSRQWSVKYHFGSQAAGGKKKIRLFSWTKITAILHTPAFTQKHTASTADTKSKPQNLRCLKTQKNKNHKLLHSQGCFQYRLLAENNSLEVVLWKFAPGFQLPKQVWPPRRQVSSPARAIKQTWAAKPGRSDPVSLTCLTAVTWLNHLSVVLLLSTWMEKRLLIAPTDEQAMGVWFHAGTFPLHHPQGAYNKT